MFKNEGSIITFNESYSSSSQEFDEINIGNNLIGNIEVYKSTDYELCPPHNLNYTNVEKSWNSISDISQKKDSSLDLIEISDNELYEELVFVEPEIINKKQNETDKEFKFWNRNSISSHYSKYELYGWDKQLSKSSSYENISSNRLEVDNIKLLKTNKPRHKQNSITLRYRNDIVAQNNSEKHNCQNFDGEHDSECSINKNEIGQQEGYSNNSDLKSNQNDLNLINLCSNFNSWDSEIREDHQYLKELYDAHIKKFPVTDLSPAKFVTLTNKQYENSFNFVEFIRTQFSFEQYDFNTFPLLIETEKILSEENFYNEKVNIQGIWHDESLKRTFDDLVSQFEYLYQKQDRPILYESSILPYFVVEDLKIKLQDYNKNSDFLNLSRFYIKKCTKNYKIKLYTDFNDHPALKDKVDESNMIENFLNSKSLVIIQVHELK